MKRKRADLLIKLLLDCFGATCTWLGLGGIAGASEGHGNLIIALIVFLIGVTEVTWSYQR